MSAMTARQHALRIAALEALTEAVAAEYATARAEAAPVFAAKYAEDGDRQFVYLPSGEKVGQITIKAPVVVPEKPEGAPAGWHWDRALLEWCEDHFPTAIEEYIDPAKVNSLDVIAAVRDKLGDDIIKRRVRTATARVLTEETVKGKGRLADRRTAEPEQVATVKPGKATGAFAFTGANSAERRERLMAALLNGDLRGVVGFGPLALPAPDPEPVVVAAEEKVADDAPPYLFADDLGFLDPVRAAMHAMFVQGGFTTPPIEAYRMIRDGGTAEVRARAWLAGQGLDPADPHEGKNTPWPPPDAGGGDSE